MTEHKQIRYKTRLSSCSERCRKTSSRIYSTNNRRILKMNLLGVGCCWCPFYWWYCCLLLLLLVLRLNTGALIITHMCTCKDVICDILYLRMLLNRAPLHLIYARTRTHTELSSSTISRYFVMFNSM